MAIMFPDSLPEPLTEYLRGEAKVFEALKTQFDKNWVVFANVNWQRKNDNSILNLVKSFDVLNKKLNLNNCSYR